MAYRNLVNLLASGPDFFKSLRDFLCSRGSYAATGLGWTLHDYYYAVDEDTISANDWFVVYSAGEDGKRDMYFRFKYSSPASLLYVTSWLYWNASTNTGTKIIASEAFLLTGVSGSDRLYVYGDLDHFVLIHYNGTNYYGAYYGRATDLAFDDTVAICSSPLSSGSDVSIAVDAVPASWAVGLPIFIRDNTDIKKITIKTLSGNTITADLTVSFSAGAKLSADHSLVFSHNNNFASNAYGLVSHNGTSGDYSNYLTAVYPTWPASVTPDTMYNEYPAAKIAMYSDSPDGYYGTLRDIYAISPTGRTNGEVLNDRAGNSYRYFNLYSAKPVVIKEV